MSQTNKKLVSIFLFSCIVLVAIIPPLPIITVYAYYDKSDDEPYSLREDAKHNKHNLGFWQELEPSEIDELCDASEDYEHFKKGCDYAYAHTSPDWEDDD